MDKSRLALLAYTKGEISAGRAAVRAALPAVSGNLTGGFIDRIAASDLRLLFNLYDSRFLGRYFQDLFPGRLTFSLSSRMTRNAGKIIYPRNIATLDPGEESYELRLGVDFFFRYYEISREKRVNGIKTADALEALQLVLEHEICHLVELHCYGSSNCRRERFRTLAGNLFGHIESYHHLPTVSEIAGRRYGFRPGDRVSFRSAEGVLTGVIQRVNKRATVMVLNPHGDFRDSLGRRYTKWYVPLAELAGE